jgi:hypothetical protein
MKEYSYAEYMVETSMVLGPDLAEFRGKRVGERVREEHVVGATALYCSSKFYKEQKGEFLTEMAKRAFPEGCRLRRKLLQSDEGIREVVEFKPSPTLSEDYFIFTLKGD